MIIEEHEEAIRSEIEGEKERDVTFLVHGAKTICPYGSRPARLIVPKSHGVFLKSKAQLNKKDSKPVVNIQSMGICKLGNIGEDYEAVDERNWFRRALDTVSSLFRPSRNVSNPDDEIVLDVCACTPQVYMDWQNTDAKLFIDNEEALLNISTVQCMKSPNATITIVDNGQN